jgi:hypothetical protein
MPRSKEGKKREKPIIAEVMAAADKVLKDGIPVRQAAREAGVSRTTLQRYLAYQSGKDDPTKYFKECAVWTVFTKEEEGALVQYLLQCSKMHYGLTRNEVKKLAFEYAKLNGKSYPDNWERDSQAGEQWYLDFMKRHEAVISLRKPEATSLARASAFNRTNVNTFFDKYCQVLEKYKFLPENIYNVDETGISTVHNTVKVVAGKGVKQVGSVTSGERGLNTTIICSVNAIGNSVPPMMVFPRVHFKEHMIKGAPPGTKGSAHVTGWSTQGLFIEYLNHFIHHVKPSKEHKVLLLLDNHESHVTIEAIDLCKANGIVLLTFPPHTSHKLQPLDRGVYGPLKKYYNAACTDWMKMHHGTPISIYDLAEIFGKAYPLAFTPSNIQAGFKVSGIWPLDRNVFRDDEFLSSSVTDRPLPVEIQPEIPRPEKENEVSVISGQDDPFDPMNSLDQPSTSGVTSVISPPEPVNVKVTPEQVRPYPKAAPRKMTGPKRGGRKPGRCRILTDTPEKLEIVAEIKEKEAKKGVKLIANNKGKRIAKHDREKDCQA